MALQPTQLNPTAASVTGVRPGARGTRPTHRGPRGAASLTAPLRGTPCVAQASSSTRVRRALPRNRTAPRGPTRHSPACRLGGSLVLPVVLALGCVAVPATQSGTATGPGAESVQQAGAVNTAADLEALLASPQVQAAVCDFLQSFEASLNASAEVALAKVTASAAATQNVQQGDQGKAQGLGQVFGDGDNLVTLVLIGIGGLLLCGLVGSLLYAFVLRPLGVRARSPRERRAARARPIDDADAETARWLAEQGVTP